MEKAIEATITQKKARGVKNKRTKNRNTDRRTKTGVSYAFLQRIRFCLQHNTAGRENKSKKHTVSIFTVHMYTAQTNRGAGGAGWGQGVMGYNW